MIRIGKFLIQILVLAFAATITFIANIVISALRRRWQTEPSTVAKTQSAQMVKLYLTHERTDQSPAGKESKPKSIDGKKTNESQGELKPAYTKELQIQSADRIQTQPVKEAQVTTEILETQKTVEKETHSKATIDQEQFEGDVSALPVQRKRLSPEKRGGKPRGTEQDSERLPIIYGDVSRPEVVCWKRERQWIVGIEVPEKLLKSSNSLQVLQNGIPLIRDEKEENRWLLEGISGEVIVSWDEGEEVQKTRVILGHECYLLFKLSVQREGQGRRVKSPSVGSYLVVVPDNWERDDAVSGPARVMPEFISLDGYRGHFFELENEDQKRIVFRTPNDKPIVIESKAPRFELVGIQLKDASESIGPLFGQKPPKIRARNIQIWKEIKTIVVGEEGGGKRKWRMSFSPKQDLVEQDLPSEVAARRGGWYFLRFYDTNDDLIESLDFRFICALKDISIPCLSSFSSAYAHNPVSVEFYHESGCIVYSSNNYTNVQIERYSNKTVLIIPPDDPRYDETHWLVGFEDGPQIEVTILLERLWWVVGEENKPPSESEWKNQPLILGRSEFAATSNKAIWVRLPKYRWVDKVFVGFEQSKARPYEIRVNERTICIPIRDFSDAQELQSVGVIQLNLWCYRQGITYTRTICELTIRFKCRFCDFTPFKKEDLFYHVESIHIGELDKFFRPLNYQELRNHIPSLPHKIFKCSYCNFYVESDDPRNPTSVITKHIERDCPTAPRGGMGPELRFRAVSDIDEIRKNVIRNLPRIHKCKLCDLDLRQEDMKEHLLRKHKNEFYVLY